MTNEERQNYRIRTECAIEILRTVHSNLCNDPDITRNNPLPEDYEYVIMDLIKLSAKLKNTDSGKCKDYNNDDIVYYITHKTNKVRTCKIIEIQDDEWIWAVDTETNETICRDKNTVFKTEQNARNNLPK